MGAPHVTAHHSPVALVVTLTTPTQGDDLCPLYFYLFQS